MGKYDVGEKRGPRESGQRKKQKGQEIEKRKKTKIDYIQIQRSN
jgi:hypothetical protein